MKVVTGIYIPSAFTPNGDGKNDVWKIPFLDHAYNATVNIFNRFGWLVYHASGEVISWDGRFHGIEQTVGTYVYIVSFKTGNLKLKGTINLLR